MRGWRLCDRFRSVGEPKVWKKMANIYESMTCNASFASPRHNALLAELARFLPAMGLSDAEVAAMQALSTAFFQACFHSFSNMSKPTFKIFKMNMPVKESASPRSWQSIDQVRISLYDTIVVGEEIFSGRNIRNACVGRCGSSFLWRRAHFSDWTSKRPCCAVCSNSREHKTPQSHKPSRYVSLENPKLPELPFSFKVSE